MHTYNIDRGFQNHELYDVWYDIIIWSYVLASAVHIKIGALHGFYMCNKGCVPFASYYTLQKVH